MSFCYLRVKRDYSIFSGLTVVSTLLKMYPCSCQILLKFFFDIASLLCYLSLLLFWISHHPQRLNWKSESCFLTKVDNRIRLFSQRRQFLRRYFYSLLLLLRSLKNYSIATKKILWWLRWCSQHTESIVSSDQWLTLKHDCQSKYSFFTFKGCQLPPI